MNRRYITIILLISLALFCKGASLGMLAHTGMDHTSMEEEHSMSCCSEEMATSESGAHHDIPINSVSYVAISIVFFGVFLLSILTVYTIPYIHYVRSYLQARGSPNIFSSYIQLFRIGLLHPKTW